MKNQSGMAIIETLPVLVIFLVLIGYSLGVFGILQTATLNSIGARVYLFETVRHRTDVTYFRTNAPTTSPSIAQYATVGNRVSRVNSEQEPNVQDGHRFPATERPLALGLSDAPHDENRNNESFHNDVLPQLYNRKRLQDGVAPVWLKIGYGLCLNVGCGDQ